MSDTTLTDAQGPGDTDLAADLAAAFEDQENTDIIGELASASDDAPDTSEPEGDGSEAETPGDDGEGDDRTDEPDPSAAAATKADTDPAVNTDVTDAYRQIGEAFGSVVSPYAAHLASSNVAAPQAVQALLSVEYQLSTGTPEQKAKILAKIAKDYNVDLDTIYGLEDQEPVNPELAQLQQRQAALERIYAGEQQQQAAQGRQQAEGQIAEFASEKDAAGNLLRPHLEKVRDAMGRAIAQNHELTLDQAYESAVSGDATLRKQALAKRRPTVAGKPAKAKAPAKPGKEPSLADDLRKQYQIAVERASA